MPSYSVIILKLSNKLGLADALSRVPPSVHPNHITAPTLLDISVLKKEVEEDEHLKEIIAKLARDEEGAPGFAIDQRMFKI